MSLSSPRASSSRLALLRRTAALAAAAAASFPAQAAAEDAAFAAGAYVSFVFGDQIGVGYGADASLMGLTTGGLDQCGPRTGFGGLLQVGGINGSTLRVVAAAQGGGLVGSEEGPGLTGELGLAAHVAAEEPGVGLHTGFLVEPGAIANLFVRGEWFLDEYSVGSGARVFGTYGIPACSIAGRPLRSASGAPLAPADAAAGRCVSADHDPIARAWAADAQAECASIPAFLQLAIDLLASGAPDALVAAALDAAEDEVRHAVACGAMASRWLDAPLRPVAPPAPLRPGVAGPHALARLAVESWLDGALNEGAAAARAAVAAEMAGDERAAALQRRIAADEARHAELGWQVLAWALRRGGADVAEQVRGHRDVEVPLARACAADARLARGLGRLDPVLDAAATEQHVRVSRARLDRLLAA